jgi:hypothetical protein
MEGKLSRPLQISTIDEQQTTTTTTTTSFNVKIKERNQGPFLKNNAFTVANRNKYFLCLLLTTGILQHLQPGQIYFM